MQHALPVTFGLKLAGTLDALLRWQQRLREMRPRLLALQFGGAAGTLDALKEKGPAVGPRWRRSSVCRCRIPVAQPARSATGGGRPVRRCLRHAGEIR